MCIATLQIQHHLLYRIFSDFHIIPILIRIKSFCNLIQCLCQLFCGHLLWIHCFSNIPHRYILIVRQCFMNFLNPFPYQCKFSIKSNIVHQISKYCISFYDCKFSIIIVTVFRITIDNPHTTYSIGIFRILPIFFIDHSNLINIGTFFISSHIMELIAFCSKVFQIRFFLRWHIVEDVINHVVICLFQFFYLCQWLIFALAFLNLYHYNLIHFFYFFHQLTIIPTDAFSSPAFVFQQFLCRFFNRNFIIFIDATIHQTEIFIVKGIIVSFFCPLNSKIPFSYLICQFTKNLFFQIQERIQLFKTDTVYKMSGYFFPVIQNYDITDRQGMPTEIFRSINVEPFKNIIQ